MNNLLKDLDHIKASQQTKQKTLDVIFSSKKKKNFKPVVLAVAMIAMLGFFLLPIQKNSSTAYISMDINPSFEFQINEDYKIIDIKAYNPDGDRIINEEFLQGKPLNDALNYLLKDTDYNQYLKNGILEVSVFSTNQQFSNELQDYMDTKLKQSQVSQYHCSQVDQTTYNNATQHHMSAGKYQIIERILFYTSRYTQDELRNLSMKELYLLLEQLNPDDVPQSCQSQRHHQKGHK